VVKKSDRSEAHQPEQRHPHIGITKVRPKQRRNHDRNDDEHAAHRRRARLFLMRFRTVLANVLPDLKFAQPRDQPGPENDAQEKRSQAGERGSERDESEYAEWAYERKELLVEQVVQHAPWLKPRGLPATFPSPFPRLRRGSP